MVTPVIKWINYTSHTDSVYSYEEFCGGCGLHLERPYGWPRSLDEAMETGDLLGPIGEEHGPLVYDKFCRHCGGELEPGPWKGDYINIRPVNHLDGNHGYHRGDEHVFKGFPPFDHFLGGTGPGICWCDPVVTAIPDGCEISHRDIKRPAYVPEQWDDDEDEED